MRNHKSVISILLAIMVVFTFMPTMAFAETTITTGHHSWGETTSVNADYEGLKVLVAPTCSDYGVGEITCTTPLNNDVCGAVKTVKINPLGHKAGRTIRIKVLDAIDYLYKDAAVNKQMKEFYAEAEKNFSEGYGCEGYVSVCDNCGKYLVKGEEYELDNIAQLADVTEHTEPSGTAECAETFKCSVCDTEAYNKDKKEHTPITSTRKAHIIKDRETNVETDYVSVTTETCSVCGKVSDPVTKVVGYEDKAINHGATTRREVASAQPCKTPTGYEDVCNDCGMVVTSGQNPLTAHTWVTSAPYIVDGLTYTKEICAVCGDKKEGSEKAVGFAPDAGTDTVSYEAVSSANCEQGSFIIATVTSADGKVTKNVLSDTDVEDAITKGDFVKIGDKVYNKSKKVEVPYTKAIGHKFGALTTVAAATCTNAGLEGKVCENCGKVDHQTLKNIEKALGHEVKEVVVPATCGEGGYTYKICTRCNEYLSKDGKDGIEAKNKNHKPGSHGYIMFSEPQKYNETKPVVAKDTACQYAWKTLEEATPFKLGTRAKVCTVCGDELAATKESVAKTAVAKPAVKVYKGKKKATVTVTAATDAVKYQILVNGKVSKTVTKAGKFTVKKGLKVGKKNTFQIKAFDTNNAKATSAKVTKKIAKKK